MAIENCLVILLKKIANYGVIPVFVQIKQISVTRFLELVEEKAY